MTSLSLTFSFLLVIALLGNVHHALSSPTPTPSPSSNLIDTNPNTDTPFAPSPCSVCVTVMNSTDYFLTHNATLAGLDNILDQIVCSKLGILEHLCDNLIGNLVKSLPNVAKTTWPINSPSDFCTALSICTTDCCPLDFSPTQIKISRGNDFSSMGISWNTIGQTAHPVLIYFDQSDPTVNYTINATQSTFTPMGWIGNVNVARMINLLPSHSYCYLVGDFIKQKFSTQFCFQNAKNDQIVEFSSSPSPFRIFMIGDIGTPLAFDNSNSNLTLSHLYNYSIIQKNIDLITIIGDISYSDGAERLMDELMTILQPITSVVPLMTIPGNHELYFNFISYRTRLMSSMPMSQSKEKFIGMAEAQHDDSYSAFDPNSLMFYSYDAAGVHFINLNSESALDTPEIDSIQMSWLKEDLQMNKQNSNTSFIVVSLHRPLYCTNTYKQCGKYASYLRSLLEDLFVLYGVDLVFQGHTHEYERTFNVVSEKVNPSGPIYIVNGAGGSREGYMGGFIQPPPVFSAFQATPKQMEESGIHIMKNGSMKGGNYGVFGFGILEVIPGQSLNWTYFANSPGEWKSDNFAASPVQAIAIDNVLIKPRK